MKKVEQIEIDTQASLALLQRGGQRVSWSKLRAFRTCPMRWFAENFAEFKNKEQVPESHEKAVPGVIIQKLFEIYFNNEVFKQYPTHQHHWFDVNLYWLYYCMKHDVEQQYAMPKDTRKWWQTPEAQQRVQWAIQQGADPAVLDKVVPKFFPTSKLEAGNEYNFLQLLRNVCRSNLVLFYAMFSQLDKVVSEQWVNVDSPAGTPLNGAIDFIYDRAMSKNPTQIQFKDGYEVWDGKFKMSSWVEEDQLQFYAWLIWLRDRALPSRLGFIHWVRNERSEIPLNTKKFDEFQNHVAQIQVACRNTENLLTNAICQSRKTIALEEVRTVEFNPSKTNCSFCPLQKNCQARKAFMKEQRVEAKSINQGEFTF